MFGFRLNDLDKKMTGLMIRTIQETKPLNIFQRLAKKEKPAVKDCIDTYGNFIWALALKFTASREEAEAATREIFIDIWLYAERTSQLQFAESVLISMIARRRLIKYLQ
ncbi:MAG: hypothetical protein ABIP06_06730 [Pyrinomonadaceae bacterium]